MSEINDIKCSAPLMMKNPAPMIGIAIVVSFILAGCATLFAKHSGKREYESHCATCHGVSGKGDGPRAAVLPIRPADLTMLAQRNGGIFPAERVAGIIDGRLSTEVVAHGDRTMPVWGITFLIVEPNLPVAAPPEETDPVRDAVVRGKRAEPADVPIEELESSVRARIKALVDYLAQLQDMP